LGGLIDQCCSDLEGSFFSESSDRGNRAEGQSDFKAYPRRAGRGSPQPEPRASRRRTRSTPGRRSHSASASALSARSSAEECAFRAPFAGRGHVDPAVFGSSV
jgi:hypothetical protein